MLTRSPKKVLSCLMPGFVGTLVQEEVEGPAEHFPEILNAAEKDVAPRHIALAFDEAADESGE